MAQEQFKRNIAYKFRIGDLIVGKPVMDGEKFSFLELGDKRVVRVNLIGNVVEKYDTNNEKKYTFITLDDGSGQIKLKAFGNDSDKLRELNEGETILAIGVLRKFNEEIYISPEIIKKQDPKYLLLRKLEVEKEGKNYEQSPTGREQKIAIRDEILEKIESSEDQGGIFVDKIIMDHKEVSPSIINQEIQKLIEEGIIFEPRPGKVRWLG